MLHGPRERITMVGPEHVSDSELLAVLLGTGAPDEPVGVLAARVLAEHGELGAVASAGVGSLSKIHGIGGAKAARLVAAFELGRRAAVCPTLTVLNDGAAVYAWADVRLRRLEQEELWVLALDARLGLRAARRVAMGGGSRMQVAAREPVRTALREGAASFILVHNHPSGDPTPSRDDIAFTERIAAAAAIVGVPLLDHVVVAQGGYVSFCERPDLTRALSQGHPLAEVADGTTR